MSTQVNTEINKTGILLVLCSCGGSFVINGKDLDKMSDQKFIYCSTLYNDKNGKRVQCQEHFLAMTLKNNYWRGTYDPQNISEVDGR